MSLLIDTFLKKFLTLELIGGVPMAQFNKYATGAAVKKLRCEKKISQEVLSGLAGIARSHLAMIESGKKQANFETIWKISTAFNVPPSELVRLIEEETERMENGK